MRIQARTAGRWLGALLSFGAAACGPPPQAPTPSVTPLPAVTAAPSVRLGLVVEGDPPALPAPVPAVPVKSLPAFAGRIEPMQIPGKARSIVAVGGRSESDAWVLAAGGPVWHWDGTRFTDKGTPKCFVDTCCGSLLDCKKDKKACSGEGAKEVFWDDIELDGPKIGVMARVYTGGLRASIVEAHLGKDGKWACYQGDDDTVQPGSRGRGDPGHAFVSTVDDIEMRFEGPAYLVNLYGGSNLVVEGRSVPLPVGDWDAGRLGFELVSPSDLWVHVGDRLWQGNGLAWWLVPTGLQNVDRVWSSGRSLWVMGQARTDDDSTNELIHWDRAKGTEARYSVPGATNVFSTKGAFWMTSIFFSGEEGEIEPNPGKSTLFHFDGEALQRAEVPLALLDAWFSPSGALWVAGADMKTGTPTAALFRLVPEGAKKP